MKTDKRSVHTDALDTLGKKIDESCKRDAIHLAVEPVMAGEELSPGQDVCVRGGKAFSTGSKLLGIIDPFLKENVEEGDMCWVILYPRTITSLRHVWDHPDFDSEEFVRNEKEIAYSQKWLEEFCEMTDCPSFERVIEVALRNPEHDSLHFSGEDASGEIPDEFWDHVEKVTGKKFDNRPTYFSCSC